MVAERYGISEQTAWEWHKRDSVHDLSHKPHMLHTALSPSQETVVVTLRTTLLLPSDDLFAIMREFINPNVSRSGLDTCLRRYSVEILRSPRERKR
jgi:hypothetical protein